MSPFSLDFWTNGDVLVVDWNGIRRFSTEGIFIQSIITFKMSNHYLHHEECAYTITVLKNGNIIVCNRLNSTIFMIDENTKMMEKDIFIFR